MRPHLFPGVRFTTDLDGEEVDVEVLGVSDDVVTLEMRMLGVTPMVVTASAESVMTFLLRAA